MHRWLVMEWVEKGVLGEAEKEVPKTQKQKNKETYQKNI